MDTEEKDGTEQESVKEFKEEEVRAKVIEDFGFDEVDDAERIDKVLARERENHKNLSTAIGQKIKIRTERDELKSKVPPPPPEAKPAAEDVGKIVAQELEKRDLDALEYSDDLKKEIQRVSQVQGISIKQAARDPYIVFKIGEWEKEQKTTEAAISRTNRSSGKKSYSIDAPPDVDMSTPDGRKEYDDWITWAKKQ